MELVELPLGTVLHEPGASMDFVYFPEDCIVSLLFILNNGSTTGLSLIGKEGLVGASIFMGDANTPNRAVIQSAGKSFRVPSQFAKEEFQNNIEILHLFLRFTQALVTQMTQTAVCNRHHAISQQLCRWLLLSLDRLPGAELVITHDLIANMLGVRREGVTLAARKLQVDEVISHSRGCIKVLNRPALESLSCECYALIKNEYERVLPNLTQGELPL